jgi:integrase
VARIRITKREVDAVRQPETGELKLWDQELRGFGLRIRAGGTKSYILQYRNAEGRTRRLTVGLCGRLTPEEARRMARQLLAAVERGEDPTQDLQDNRRAPTVAEFAVQYMELHARPKKKPRSVEKDEAILRLYILPALASRKLAAVTAADVARLHRDLGAHPVQANRVVALLSKMCSLAEVWEMRPRGSNPCRGLRRYAERRRERFLSYSEFSRLGEVLAVIEAEGREAPAAILAIRLLALTGARRDEILTLRWDFVDLERGVLRLPDSKTGAKIIPLGAAAAQLLAAAPRMKDNPYVCPGRRSGGRLVGLQDPWQRIRERASLPGVRLHDLRHSWASTGAAGGLGLPIIGKILGHLHPITTHRYTHFCDDPLRAAADRVAGEIDSAMRGGPRAEVIPLRTGSALKGGTRKD